MKMGTQGAVAIGVGHLQLVSGNQMETHLLNAIVNHGFFRLGSPSEFCHTCGYGHPISSTVFMHGENTMEIKMLGSQVSSTIIY